MTEVLSLLLIGVAGGTLWLLLRNRALAAAARSAEAQSVGFSQQLAMAAARIEAYRPIIDVEAHASLMLRETERAVERSHNEARQLALTLHRQASAQLREADERLAEAEKQASTILAEAEKSAQATAGDALRARESEKQVEATLQAMRNTIEGYGDLYIVPTDSLLDELVNDVGFSDVGHALRAAREHGRSMVKASAAATCDDASESRRLLTVRFVLDAFNGKVDSVLADVRHDNFGTLQQKIRDAAWLVNKNGQAFENARILPEYVEARIAELKWTVAAHELKRCEQEEQHTLKERMREEEREQRDFERAMREATEEQAELRAAIARARRERKPEGTDERSKYVAQLAELSARLTQAEEKQKHATSMAQQTKRGTVYVLSNVGSFGERIFKIGMTRRLNPQHHVDDLGAVNVPFPFDVHAFITTDDAPRLERQLHRQFADRHVNKVNPRNEFFRASLTEIKDAVTALGAAATWNLAAESREYRESLALESQPSLSQVVAVDWLPVVAERQVEARDSMRERNKETQRELRPVTVGLRS